MHGTIPGAGPVITSHPDHVRSLFTAKPEQAPSLTGESPLRPIVGPNSVLTAVGPRHMRQRKLLLPPFHGEAIEQYTQMIADAAEREIDRWPLGTPLRPGAAHAGDHARRDHGRDLRHRGQAGARHARALAALRDQAPRRRLDLAAGPGRRADEPQPRASRSASTRVGLELLDRADLRGDRAAPPRRRPRASGATSSRCCCRRAPRSGEALSDKELRDELLTLVLAGHETTANSLAWTWERLVRTPAAHEAAARRGPRRGRRRRADRGDDRRGDALAAGDPDHRPAGEGALAARRLRGAGRTRR